MKIGLQIPNFTWRGGDAAIGGMPAEIGRAAEEAGFDSIWVMDNFFQLEIASLKVFGREIIPAVRDL